MQNTLFPEGIAAKAAYWAVRMKSEELSPDERKEFERWLSADSRHLRDFNSCRSVVQMAGELPPDVAERLISLVEASPPARHRKFKVSMLAAGVAFAAVAAVLFVVSRSPKPLPYVTRAGEVRSVTLEDGSQVHLNTRTRLEWDGDKRDRRVQLLEGEALFEVVPDAARPFQVMVEDSEIRVLGTRFNVYRKQDGTVEVTVIEGAVQVREWTNAAGAASWTRELGENHQIVYRSGAGIVSEVHRVSAPASIRWREGRVFFGYATLAEVVEELSRYTDRRVVISDPRVANMRIGGTFSLDDLSGTLREMQGEGPFIVIEDKEAIRIDYDENWTASGRGKRK